ncbi:MAG TPA: TonB-dependent receptor, partial [Ferruginibacter sp.]|nr:TonB-dependent receptor [Ferruginibacter sp.]
QAANKANIWGGSIGGPIIKNKLFFFINAEREIKSSPPLVSFSPTGGSGQGNISNTNVDSLKKFSDYLASQYSYETGVYDNFPAAQSENKKYLGKLDWNLSTVHKITVKYNVLQSTNDQGMSNSVPNSASTGVNSWTTQNRFGTGSMSFQNSQYKFSDNVKSAAFEINSNWKGRFSNQLIATYTKVRTTRSTGSTLFPFIDLIGPTPYSAGGRNNYMSAGKENFSNNNDVKNNIVNVTENFNYYLGRHILTLGGAYEYQFVGNQFMPASQGYYAYGSLAEFMNPAAHPIAYSYTFSRVPGDEAPYSANMKIAQLGIYGQDEFNINSKLKVILGLRLDKPMYPDQPLENPAITALTFPGKDGTPTHYSTGQWPKSSWYWSPRLSVRWDMMGDKSLIVRAGTGVYTGKIPFVYLTNMPTNSGMYQVSVVANAAQLAGITFSPDPNKWRSLFTVAAPTPNTAGFILIDNKYKFPQVWRTNFGFDKRFAKGWTFGMDILYTKDLNTTVMRNANQTAPTGTVNLGGSTRPSFTNTTTSTRRVYNAYANAIVLENNDDGGAFSFTTSIAKSYSKGFYASLAYTFSAAMDVTANPGSTASSTWSGNPTSGTQNDKELSFSNFAAPHRIVGTLSYRKEYIKHLGTTISAFYEGSQFQSGRISYIYGSGTATATTGLPAGFSNTGDVNFDGNSSDLMYIPRDPSEITFIPMTVGSGATAVTYTAQQQSDAFFAFVNQDKYLSKRKGQVAERNGAQYPFYHKVDVKLLQDIFTNIGKRRMTLQGSIDVLNALNLINKNWG